MTASYVIRPVGAGDLPILAAWRRQAHVRRWWGPADSEPEAEKLREPSVAMWIVSSGGRPIAFVQDYAVADWSPHHLDDLPPGSRGLDIYIGDVEAVGRGHGSRIVRQHVESLFGRGTPAVGLDPHPDNRRARRAFERAGFVMVAGPLDTRWGRAVLMHRFA